MTDFITEEILEATARALFTDEWGKPPDGTEAWLGDKHYWLSHARAALTAIIPEVVEKCARAASEACWKHEGDNQYSRGMDAGARHQTSACVTAIRSLIPKEKNNNG
jgi:hypothetical protein